MSLSSGDAVSAAVTNLAFMSRSADDNTTGIKSFENTDSASGSSVTNGQREWNSLCSYTGKALNAAKDVKPSWTSNEMGASTDSLFVRLNLVDAQFNNSTGHDHSGAGLGAPIDSANIIYDGTTSGLSATDVQAAIDEVDSDLDTHIADTAAPHGATSTNTVSRIITRDSNGDFAANDITASTLDATGVDNSLGNLTLGNSGNTVVIAGNLQVDGATTTVNSTTLEVDDANITVNSGGNQAAANSAVSGITVEMSDATDAVLGYDSSTTSKWKAGESGSEAELVTISHAQQLTNKDIDGGTASNSNRITVPKNTTSNLSGLTRKQATIVYDTDLDKLFYDDGTSLIEVGSGAGGGGGILTEYIENSDAETDTTGWTVYANTSAGTQPDDFGGTPSGNVTWTRSTSSPARGDGHFVLTKDASDRQGEGVYYDFDLENGDLATVLRISLEAQELSGTYADGDVRIYLVSSSDNFSSDFNIIEPTPTELLSSSFWLKSIFRAQTDASDTDYRLCAHIASTSTTAYTVGFDSISCGYAPIVYGTPITDWQAYTPTFGSGFGAVSSIDFEWRRVGDSVEIFGRFQTGTVTTGNPTVSLPSGLVTKSGVVTTIAGGALTDTTTGDNYAAVYQSNQTHVLLTRSSGSGGSFSAVNTNAIFNNSELVGFRALVPIEGWGSSTQVSEDADTRVVAAKYEITASTANSSFADAALEIVDWDNKIFDTHNAVTTGASWKYTVPVSGSYRINAGLTWASPTNLVSSDMYVFVNGASVSRLDRRETEGLYTAGTALVNVNKGDFVDIRISQDDSGGAARSVLTSATFSHVEVERLSGPAQIAANENIRGRFSTTAGQSIDGSSTEIVNFDTLTYDTHGAVTTGASWEMAAPASGEYEVDAQVSYASASWTAGEIQLLMLYKNGSFYSYLDLHEAVSTSSYRICLNGSDKILLDKGDTIDIRTNSGNASARSLDTSAGLNYVSFRRTGL